MLAQGLFQSSSNTIPYGDVSDEEVTVSESKRGRGSRARRSRGTGRGLRGRGRTGEGSRRGKSRRVGTGKTRMQQTDCERLARLREDRSDRLKNLIEDMSEEQVRTTLLKVAEQSPGLVLHIASMVKPDDQHPPQPDPVAPGTPHWCVCQNCREMPTDLERLCCGYNNDQCTREQPEMDYLVLDPMVLALQQRYRNDVFALQAVTVEDVNKSNRHAAYRQYTLWQYNRLGEGIRRVIPSCCVWKIRSAFPDPQGSYTGYIPGRLH